MKKIASNQEPAARRFCGLPPTPERRFDAGVSPGRARAIIANQSKWVNGTVLSYYFMGGPASQKAAMRKAFKVWEDVGIGISFKEVSSRDDAQIRISFADDGSWSYVGRTILTIPKSEATMNIGWDISADLDTGVHEIGHTLGMPHEHQNPFAGIVWDEPKVYASLAAPPNKWDQQKTYWNIIRKIPKSEVTGTAWDPNSIMHYPFEAGLIIKPLKYASGLTPAGGLSKFDKNWVRKIYPKKTVALKTLVPFVSVPLELESGDEASFQFKPAESRTHVIKTFGNSDAVLVLFEETKGGPTYVKGVDDSGLDLNGELKVDLKKDSNYSIRVRLLHKNKEDKVAIMVW